MLHTEVKARLREFGFYGSRANQTRYCRCTAHCSAWQDHPLGRALNGRKRDFHLLAELVADQEAHRTSDAGDASARAVWARVQSRLGDRGRYLVPIKGACSADARCALMVSDAEEAGWQGQCMMHRQEPEECFVGRRAAGVRPFDRLRQWEPEHGPVAWEDLYKWVDRIFPTRADTLASVRDRDRPQETTSSPEPASPLPSSQPPAHPNPDQGYPAPAPARRSRSPTPPSGRASSAPPKRPRLSAARQAQLEQLYVEQQEEDDERVRREEAERRARDEAARKEAGARRQLDVYAAKLAECGAMGDGCAGLEAFERAVREAVAAREVEAEAQQA